MLKPIHKTPFRVLRDLPTVESIWKPGWCVNEAVIDPAILILEEFHLP